jgi:hypothetical protein
MEECDSLVEALWHKLVRAGSRPDEVKDFLLNLPNLSNRTRRKKRRKNCF